MFIGLEASKLCTIDYFATPHKQYVAALQFKIYLNLWFLEVLKLLFSFDCFLLLKFLANSYDFVPNSISLTFSI